MTTPMPNPTTEEPRELERLAETFDRRFLRLAYRAAQDRTRWDHMWAEYAELVDKATRKPRSPSTKTAWDHLLEEVF